MNVFQEPEVAKNYDAYYQTELGREVDRIEKEMISELIADLPRASLLDLGCGTGHWSGYFEKEGFSVTGVDASEAMLRYAEQRELAADLLKAPAEALPFAGGSFDAIATIAMLEFVDSREKVVQEMYRVLKPGGHLIVGALNLDSAIGKNQKMDPVFEHANLFREEELSGAFQPFEILSLKRGVYLDDQFALVPPEKGVPDLAPAFFGLLLQKTDV